MTPFDIELHGKIFVNELYKTIIDDNGNRTVRVIWNRYY